MSVCSHCNSKISFMSVLNTPNPLRLKCTSCKSAIYIDKLSGGIAALIIIALSVFILVSFYGVDNYFFTVLIPVGLTAEFIYFMLIKTGLVKIKNNI